jgi:hypothetical protein
MKATRLNIKEKRGKIFSSMPVYFALQPSLRRSAHSSQDVPFWNVHIPYSLPSGFFLISVVPPMFPQLTEAGFAIPTGAAVVDDIVTPALQPSLRKSAHSSQDVPFGNVHMPYSLPSGFFLISVVPLIFPQLTDAGLAIPAEVGDTVFIAVMVAVGVVTGGACWVQPAMKIPATMQRPRMIKTLFLVIMIYSEKVL